MQEMPARYGKEPGKARWVTNAGVSFSASRQRLPAIFQPIIPPSARGNEADLVEVHRRAMRHVRNAHGERRLTGGKLNFTQGLVLEIVPRPRGFYGPGELCAAFDSHREAAAVVFGLTGIIDFHSIAACRTRADVQLPGDVVLAVLPGADVVREAADFVKRGPPMDVRVGGPQQERAAGLRLRGQLGFLDLGRPGERQFDYGRDGVELCGLRDVNHPRAGLAGAAGRRHLQWLAAAEGSRPQHARLEALKREPGFGPTEDVQVERTTLRRHAA